MPVIHIYTPEGFLSPARKKLMVERVTKAAVDAEGLPTTDRTYVLVHDVPDGGWGWQGDVIDHSAFRDLLPPDPSDGLPNKSAASQVRERFVEISEQRGIDGCACLDDGLEVLDDVPDVDVHRRRDDAVAMPEGDELA